MEFNVEKDSLKENCLNEYIVSKQKLDKNGFLLNTFIYFYLIRFFKNVEFYLNEDKVQHSLTKEIFDKIKILNDIIRIRRNKKKTEINSVYHDETNGIKQEEENKKILFTNVKHIVLNIFLLENTKEQLKFPYNLVKLKIEINVDNSLVKVKSLEYTLIKRNWSFSLHEVFNKEAYEQMEDAQLIIYFKKNTAQEEQKKVKQNIVNAINSHCIFCKTNFDNIKEDVDEKSNNNNVANNFIDAREKQIFENGLRENEDMKKDSDINKIKNEINHLLFLLYEPAFYNISLKKENDICYKKMYDQFKKIMIRSRTLQMNKKLIAYLLCESIFLPNYVKKNKFKHIEEDEYSSISSYSKSSSELENCTRTVEEVKDRENMENIENRKNQKHMEETEENYSSGEVTLYGFSEDNSSGSNAEEKDTNEKKKKKKTMKELFRNQQFRDILEKIKNEIEELDNSVFLRVNWKNLKSGSFVNDYNLEVKTLYDALLMLKSATSVFKILKRNKKKKNYLIFSKYVNINICCLFQVYVYNNEIIAVSQKYLNHYFSFLNDPISIIDTISLIKTFFDTNLKNSFFFTSYICQLYIHSFKKTNKKKVLLINAKSWIYKNKHPFFTNQFLKQYIYTGEKGIEVKDIKFNKHNVLKFQLNQPSCKKEEEEKKETKENIKKSNELFDFYFYDGILFFCITKDDAIYKKNTSIYPKDMNYIREGEIDVNKLMDTMKRENNIQ